jgi:hypothetical protein
MMSKDIVFSETFFTSLIPKRVFRIADECLVEIRVIENRRESSTWIYEYEVSGEFGKVEKFLVRIRNIGVVE